MKMAHFRIQISIFSPITIHIQKEKNNTHSSLNSAGLKIVGALNNLGRILVKKY